ncbi:MAG: septum formation initiator family protein [Treponema sp.]|jgi:cell division protein FtsB|nr:septum formation initiator family protein [Treponema sp.]
MMEISKQAKKARLFFFLKWLTTVWFGSLVYAVLAFTVGGKGLIAYDALTQERDRLQANFNSIRETNKRLNVRNILFGSYENDPKNPAPADPDTILIEARNMGYGMPGENAIHFNGIERKEKTYIDPGTPEYAFKVKGFPDHILKIISFLSAISLLLCLILPDILDFFRYLYEENSSLHQHRAKFF